MYFVEAKGLWPSTLKSSLVANWSESSSLSQTLSSTHFVLVYLRNSDLDPMSSSVQEAVMDGLYIPGSLGDTGHIR